MTDAITGPGAAPTTPDQPPLRFGLVTSVPDLDTGTDLDQYREAFRLVEMAEDLGFDNFWFTEHHFSKHGLDSAVLTLTAALAAKTSRIRLGTAVSVLPFWNPVRLAEEVAVVDLVSNGRFELGVGSGYRVHEFTGLGIDVDERTPRFLEALDIIDRIWDGEPFQYDGQFYHLDSRGLRPRPLQKPHPPIWVAAQSEVGIRWAGERRAGWMFVLGAGQRVENLGPARDLYVETVTQAGGPPRIYFHSPTTTARRSTAQIRAELEPWAAWWFDAVSQGETIWNRSGGGAWPRNLADFFANGYHGDPDHVLRQIEKYLAFGVTDFCFHVAYGPPLDRVRESIATLAADVLPVARRLNRPTLVG